MRYVSVFSGVEAATVAWEPLGWEPVAFCEVDAFPSAVLAERFPDVPNLGDITQVDWERFKSDHGTVDLVVGGSPCQSFSVAGKREGLSGASGLMWEYVRCVRELRPRWFVWENVPGALSSEGGEAFRCLLASMDDLGYYCAWRVLDAQFFGVAQRRRRVFLVGSLGNERCADVLFEPEGLRWNTPSSRDKRKELAARARSRAEGADGGVTYCIQGDIARGAHMGQNGRGWSDTGECYTLNTMDVHAVTDAPKPCTLQVRCGKEGGGKGALIQEDMSATLSCANVQTLFQPTAYGFSAGQSGKAGSLAYQKEQSPTLRAGSSGTNQVPTVVIDRAAYNQGVNAQYNPHIEETDVMDTLVARGPHAVGVREGGYVVRKLTPRECERLNGFPDDWTRIPWRDKPEEDCPDAPRYKAMGNSMAVPVMRWIGERIQAVESNM